MPDFNVNDGTLCIIQNSKNLHFPRSNGNDNCIITITVPKETELSRISGGCALGDVEFNGLTVDEIDIECDISNKRMPFHADKNPCPVAACAMNKNISFCG